MKHLKDLCETISSSSTLNRFQQEVELAASSVAPLSSARYFLYSDQRDLLLHQGKSIPVDLSSQPGYCAFYRESTDKALPVPGLVDSSGARSIPVKYFGQLAGVLTVVKKSEEPGDQDLRRLLDVIGLLQEHVSSREELRAFTDQTRDLMVVAVESIQGNPGHVGRVARLCTELAALLDLSAQIKGQLFRAAHYHDVGMLSLQSLSRAESRRAHCAAGADFLRTTRNLSDLADLVETHHERFDGSGFPQGFTGSELPIDCWVLPLAEHLEEFVQSQVNSTLDEALKAFFEKEAQRHHPEVIDALCGLIDSGRLQDILDSKSRVLK